MSEIHGEPQPLDPHATRLDLGAYVLGALTAGERDVVDAHLLTCPTCSAELDTLTSLPLFLDLVGVDEVSAMGTGASAADPALVDRVVAAVVAERRTARRRRWALSVAAAAVLVVGSSVAGVALSSSGAHGTAQAAEFSATDPSSHAWAQIDVEPKAWGASLNLKLTGVPSGEHCKLVAIGRDGSTEVAASWEATYTGSATVTGATSLTLSSTSAYEIVSFAGKRLVNVPTPG